MVNILFTSVGRRVELIKAFCDGYKKLNIKGSIVGIDIDPLAPALQLVDKSFIVPRLSSIDYIPTLIEICKRENIAAIFPLIDPDIPVLAANRNGFEQIGCRIAVPPLDAIDIVDDKWLTTQFFSKLGLAVPRSWLPNTLDIESATYPLFIKPRRGSAAKNVFKVKTQRELEFFVDYVANPLIQEFIDGIEITNDVMIDLNGEVLEVVSRQRIEVRSGEVSKGITVFDARIKEACTRIAQALPALGPITVQCILRENQLYFTEINGRMGGGLPLAIAAGADLPSWLISRLANIAVEVKPYQVGLYMSRYDETFFLSQENYDQIQSYCI